MHRFGVSLACVLATATALPSTSRAQGYGVYEQGACTMGRGGTAVSNPCADGSGIYFNPAGIVGRSWSGSLGATLISPGAEFVNDETAIQSSFLDAVYPVPTLYVSGPISNQLAVGLGVFVPYGLTTEWDEDNFEGRFLGYKTTLSAIYIQPTVAARFGNLKVGGGVNFTRLHLQLNRRADLSQVTVASATLPPGTTFGNLGIPFGTDFADTRIDGTAWGVGYNVGAIYDVGTMLSVGARYTSRQKIEAKTAEATFTPVSTGLVLTAGNPFGVPGGTPVDSLVASQFRPGGLLVDQRVSSAIRLPDQLVLGLTVKPIVPLSFSFDAQHTWWKVFDEVPIDFAESDVLDQSLVLGANNVWTLRFGAEYQFANRGRTTVRGGFITHKAALPDSSVTPLLPEGPRNDFTLGVGTGIGRSVYVDVAYMYVNQADRRGRTVGLEQLDGEITNGLFRNQYAHLFGLTVTVDF